MVQQQVLQGEEDGSLVRTAEGELIRITEDGEHWSDEKMDVVEVPAGVASGEAPGRVQDPEGVV